VFAEDEAVLLIEAAADLDQLEAMVAQRKRGLPIEHIVGWAEFAGHRIVVDHNVFVPRRRTEFLAIQAIAVTRAGAVVLDMCCGSGAVAFAVASAAPGIKIHAVDIEPSAVRCASRNLNPLGGLVYEGDLYAPLPAAIRGRIDVIVANAPYVPTDAIGLLPREARLHEPAVTLDGGLDGLEIQRRIAERAPLWLATGGHLLIETSDRQAPLTSEIFTTNGFATAVVESEELGATVVVGVLPAASR
jgi:release factor glutamine methyltransferase